MIVVLSIVGSYCYIVNGIVHNDDNCHLLIVRRPIVTSLLTHLSPLFKFKAWSAFAIYITPHSLFLLAFSRTLLQTQKLNHQQSVFNRNLDRIL